MRMPRVRLAVPQPVCLQPAQEAGGLLGRMAWALVRTLLPAASPMANACEPGARVVLLLQPDLASLRDQERSLASDKGLRSHCST